MVGWYRPTENVQKENMEVMRSFNGVVLYKRMIHSGNTPYVLFNKGKLIVEITEETLALIAFNDQLSKVA